MSEPQDTGHPVYGANGDQVHDAAVWARGTGFEILAVALDAIAAELGYEPPADSTDAVTESGAHSTE